MAKTTPGTRISPVGSIRHRHGPSGFNVTMRVRFPARVRPCVPELAYVGGGIGSTGTQLTRSYERG